MGLKRRVAPGLIRVTAVTKSRMLSGKTVRHPRVMQAIPATAIAVQGITVRIGRVPRRAIGTSGRVIRDLSVLTIPMTSAATAVRKRVVAHMASLTSPSSAGMPARMLNAVKRGKRPVTDSKREDGNRNVNVVSTTKRHSILVQTFRAAAASILQACPAAVAVGASTCRAARSPNIHSILPMLSKWGSMRWWASLRSSS